MWRTVWRGLYVSTGVCWGSVSHADDLSGRPLRRARLTTASLVDGDAGTDDGQATEVVERELGCVACKVRGHCGGRVCVDGSKKGRV
jgi:hypothetical protein